MAPMIITALLQNQLIATSGDRILNNRRIPVTPIAVTSKGKISIIKKITASTNTDSSIIKSTVIIIPE